MRPGLKTRISVAKRWLRDGAPLWSWLLTASILLSICYFFPGSLSVAPITLSDRVRWSGMLFEFVGLATVIRGLNETRQLFDRETVWRSAWNWIKRARFIVKSLPPITGSGNAVLEGVTVSGEGVADVARAPRPLEERVALLERELEHVHEGMSRMKTNISHLHRQAIERVESERNERIWADERVARKLEETAIGGLALEASGVTYLFFGIALTSISDEIAWALGRLGL